MLSPLIDASTRLRLLTTRFLVRLGFREDSFFLILAILVGIVAAAAAVVFHELIVKLRELLFAGPGEKNLYGKHMYLLVLIPAAGGLVVGVLSKLVFKVKGIHGLVDVMESVIRSKGFISPTAAVEKILTSGITIGTGGSVGAEAPIVQIGAAIASGFGRLLGLSRQYMPLVIGCGSAAGISAIFNAPIGGVLFALEVMLQDFSIRTFAPVVVASVIANVTTKAIMQHFIGVEYVAIFALPDWSVRQQLEASWSQMGNFLILGVACGVCGAVFTRIMMATEHVFAHLKIPAWVKPSIGGLIVGLLGLVYVFVFGRVLLGQTKPIPFETYPMPALFSDGYGAMQPMLTSAFYTQWSMSYLVMFLIGLLVMKMLAACMTVGSGGGGGVIGPALFLGTLLGGLFGVAFKSMGGTSVQPEIYALVGMGAVLAATIHAPMASIMILLELTQDYKLTLPAMIATVAAVGFSRMIYRDSLYSAVLRERGLRLGTAADESLLRRMHVEHVNLEPASAVMLTDPFQRIIDLIGTTGAAGDFVVLNDKGLYAGMVVADDIKMALIQREAVPLLLVSELMRTNIPLVQHSDDLATVLDTFSVHEVSHLPVCVEGSEGRVIGLISRSGLMRRYQQRLAEGN